VRSDRLLVLALVGVLSSCSLGNVQPELCSASADCRDEFGFGWTCGDTGYCEAIDVSNRCDVPYPTDLFDRPEAYSDTIVLGTLFDFDDAEENLRAIELAVDEANIEDGLNGTSFALVNCNYTQDLELDGDDAVTAAKRLTTWLTDEVGVPAIVGPGSSPIVQQIWPEADAAGVLLVAPSSTSDLLTEIDGAVSTDEDPGLFWRTAPPDVFQSAAIVQDLNTRGAANVAILYQDGAYGLGLAEAIEAGLTVPVERFRFENSNDLTAAIADAGVSDADHVVFVSSAPTDVSAFLNGANATGDYTAKTLFLTDSARDGTILDAAALASDLFPNVRGSVPVADPSTDVLEDTFYLAYSQRYGVDASRDGFNTFSYDAAWITLYGIAWADAQGDPLTGTTIARGLRQLSNGPEVPIRAASWDDVLESFAAGESIDVIGASGTLDFDPVTGETRNPIAIWTLEDDGGGYDFVDTLICYPDEGCEPFPE
jgi:ABC-type branched-subunit amino acid transport system substrate-binding protein